MPKNLSNDVIASLLSSIDDRTYKVGIVGLGYVGLPLAWTFLQKGFSIIGFDVDESKISSLDEGKSYIMHLGDEVYSTFASSQKFEATNDFSRVSEADCLLLCVPTPLNKYREPEMSYVENTARTVGRYLRKGQLIILESTTYPGTTEELIRPICEVESGLIAGEDFFLAYSPEREDPGNANFSTAKIPKVVGADGDNALKIAAKLYEAAIAKVVTVSNTKTAEAVKLLENIFRSVNIALVNELKIVFQKMGIDVHEVIDAAKTKPFGYMPFYPGPGLGGHCIPIDPFYLTWKAREFGVNTKFIELAGEVNTLMPNYVLQRTFEALNANGKPLNGSKILCVGLAYKPNVDDARESPTFVIMDLLKSQGAIVDYFDPYVPVIPSMRDHPSWKGKQSIDWSEEIINSYDAAIVVTHHDNIAFDELKQFSQLVVDTRNVIKSTEADASKVWKA